MFKGNVKNVKIFKLIKNLQFCSFIIFNRTHGTSKPGNYIYENDY